jgi:hypothetical protein
VTSRLGPKKPYNFYIVIFWSTCWKGAKFHVERILRVPNGEIHMKGTERPPINSQHQPTSLEN